MTETDKTAQERERFEAQGPYHYAGDVHPSLNIRSSTGRIVGCIYIVDEDMDRAEAEADACVLALDAEHGQARAALDTGAVCGKSSSTPSLDVDALAQETRRVDGNHDLGAGALAEALMPFLSAHAAHPDAYRQGAEGRDDWRDDPSADERWNAGCDFAMLRLCSVLGIDPGSVRWDAATETVDGDVRAVIRNIIEQALGENWQDRALPLPGDKEG